MDIASSQGDAVRSEPTPIFWILPGNVVWPPEPSAPVRDNGVACFGHIVERHLVDVKSVQEIVLSLPFSFSEKSIMFGSPFSHARFVTLESVSDPAVGDRIEQVLEEALAKLSAVFAFESNHRLEGSERLDRSLETDRSQFDGVFYSGQGAMIVRMCLCRARPLSLRQTVVDQTADRPTANGPHPKLSPRKPKAPRAANGSDPCADSPLPSTSGRSASHKGPNFELPRVSVGLTIDQVPCGLSRTNFSPSNR